MWTVSKDIAAVLEDDVVSADLLRLKLLAKTRSLEQANEGLKDFAQTLDSLVDFLGEEKQQIAIGPFRISAYLWLNARVQMIENLAVGASEASRSAFHANIRTIHGTFLQSIQRIEEKLVPRKRILQWDCFAFNMTRFPQLCEMVRIWMSLLKASIRSDVQSQRRVLFLFQPLQCALSTQR